MPKNHVASNKISGNHTTLIDAAMIIAKAAIKLKTVRRVAPGFIKNGIGTLRKFPASIKITPGKNYIKISVRGKTSIQEIHIYTSDVQNAINRLLQVTEKEGYCIKKI